MRIIIIEIIDEPSTFALEGLVLKNTALVLSLLVQEIVCTMKHAKFCRNYIQEVYIYCILLHNSL